MVSRSYRYISIEFKNDRQILCGKCYKAFLT